MVAPLSVERPPVHLIAIRWFDPKQKAAGCGRPLLDQMMCAIPRPLADTSGTKIAAPVGRWLGSNACPDLRGFPQTAQEPERATLAASPNWRPSKSRGETHAIPHFRPASRAVPAPVRHGR